MAKFECLFGSKWRFLRTGKDGFITGDGPEPMASDKFSTHPQVYHRGSWKRIGRITT